MRSLAPSVCICTTNKEIALDKNNEDPVDKFDSSFPLDNKKKARISFTVFASVLNQRKIDSC